MVFDFGVVMALFLAIALSSLFAGEWHDNTSSLVLTTKNGWKKSCICKSVHRFCVYSRIFCDINDSKYPIADILYGNHGMGYAYSEYQAYCSCTYEYASG